MDSIYATASSLREDQVKRVLAGLHNSAKADKFRFMGLMSRALLGKIQGKPFHEAVTPRMARDIYMPISAGQGAFVYQTARALGAKTIVEFGTSFGISTIYLASAVKDNGGGLVIGTEIEPSKHAQAIKNLTQAGLDTLVDVRLGDAMQTLQELPAPVDMVLLDGWKNLYLPVLELLKPHLRRGAVVLADNIFTFKKGLRPYVEHMQSGRNGFESTTLRIADGLEYSVYIGAGAKSQL